MSNLKLLIVEDHPEDLETLKTSVKAYNLEKHCEIDCMFAVSVSEALNKLDNTYDGALIDLKLGIGGNEGEEIVKQIQGKYRIPVAIITGTPSNAAPNNCYIGFYKKGETKYSDIFDEYFKIYETGLTKIMGSRGIIEETLNKTFWQSIIPRLDSWISYADSEHKTEKALLRFTLNHLLETLDLGSDPWFNEEMYLNIEDLPLKTGAIVQKLDTKSPGYFIVLSPACDLECYDGRPKTDCVLICEIEKRNSSLIAKLVKDTKDADEDKKIKAVASLEKLIRNNYSNYYHYLPNSNIYEGGFINFRRISTYSPKEFMEVFKKPVIQIESSFVKDIVSRFSSYYARQGQPNFDFEKLKNDLMLCVDDPKK